MARTDENQAGSRTHDGTQYTVHLYDAASAIEARMRNDESGLMMTADADNCTVKD